MEKEDKQLEQMVKQFKLAIFWAFIGMLVLFLLFGCGSSRKVEKQHIKEETEKKEKIVTKNTVNGDVKSKKDQIKEDIQAIYDLMGKNKSRINSNTTSTAWSRNFTKRRRMSTICTK